MTHSGVRLLPFNQIIMSLIGLTLCQLRDFSPNFRYVELGTITLVEIEKEEQRVVIFTTDDINWFPYLGTDEGCPRVLSLLESGCGVSDIYSNIYFIKEKFDFSKVKQ